MAQHAQASAPPTEAFDLLIPQHEILRRPVMLLGAQAVGKTSILSLFGDDEHTFDTNYKMTLTAALQVKKVVVPNTNVEVELFVVDAGGHEVCQKVRPEAYILVFDVTNESSFQDLDKYLAMIHQYHAGSKEQTESPIILLIGNKCDLNLRRVVRKETAAAWAKKQNITYYFETSATRREDVETPFFYLTSMLHKRSL